MAKRKSVPDDLMGSILSDNYPATEAEVSPDGSAERIGVAFNLPKRLVAELDLLRRESKEGEGGRISRSEIAEAAFSIALEDARNNGYESELHRRLGDSRSEEERSASVANTDPDKGANVVRSVDDSGWIFETTYDASGKVVDEDIVSNVSDLPVTDEYTDEEGRLVSLAKDELGNAFETVFDDSFEVILTRMLQSPDAAQKDWDGT